MTRKFVRILLATIVGVALSGITACDQPAPTEQADMDMDMDMDMEEAAEMAAPPVEMVEEEAMEVEEAELEEEDTE
jgi:hypothetical protein